MLSNWKVNIFLTVVFWTVANLFLKHASNNPNVEWRLNTMFWMMGSLLFSVVSLFFLKKYVEKPNKGYVASAVSGVICAISIGVASVLYAICDASKIAPIMGLATPLSGVVCLLLFKEKITWRIFMGFAFAGVCVYMLG